MDDVLGKQDALEFEEDKVQELFKILIDSLDRLLRDGVVFTRAERACETLRQHESTTELGGSGD